MLIAFFVNAMADEYQGYTTTLLAHEASRRGHDVCYVTPEDFVFDDDERLRAHARFVTGALQPRRRTLGSSSPARPSNGLITAQPSFSRIAHFQKEEA